jgi:hypothetical protein
MDANVLAHPDRRGSPQAQAARDEAEEELKATQLRIYGALVEYLYVRDRSGHDTDEVRSRLLEAAKNARKLAGIEDVRPLLDQPLAQAGLAIRDRRPVLVE